MSSTCLGPDALGQGKGAFAKTRRIGRAWIVLFAMLMQSGCYKNEVKAGEGVEETFDRNVTTAFGAAVVRDRHISLAKGMGVDGSDAVKVDYIGNAQGSERVTVSYRLPQKSVEYTLKFDVNFCKGFDFAKGGKLHGLGPERPVAGGESFDASQWSARLMFRGDGGLQTYIYHQDMPGKYGQVVVAKGFRFEPGKYYSIKYQLRLNTPPDKSNGAVRVFVNEKEVIQQNGIRFRAANGQESLISTLMFNTFHGGHKPEWAPRNDDGSYAIDCAYYDNFVAYPMAGKELARVN
jgi:hypothetical protein